MDLLNKSYIKYKAAILDYLINIKRFTSTKLALSSIGYILEDEEICKLFYNYVVTNNFDDSVIINDYTAKKIHELAGEKLREYDVFGFLVKLKNNETANETLKLIEYDFPGYRNGVYSKSYEIEDMRQREEYRLEQQRRRKLERENRLKEENKEFSISMPIINKFGNNTNQDIEEEKIKKRKHRNVSEENIEQLRKKRIDDTTNETKRRKRRHIEEDD